MGKAQVEGFECVRGRRGRPGDANAPINVNPLGEGVRARGGDLMSETIPLSGF